MEVQPLKSARAQAEDVTDNTVIRELTVDELLEVSGGPQIINDGGAVH